jgi:hypothetical protein
MRFWHSLTRGAKLILIANSAFALILVLVCFHLISPGPKVADPIQSSSTRLVQNLMSQRSLASMSLWDAQLEQAERDTGFVAEVASHIFSHPQSFRLAAQPGEYDFDSASGLYGSLRNDGTSVLLLSAETHLSPEILHDIRLSEYLNPVFKSIMSLKLQYSEISLYTTDSLLRSYPWFDVKQRLAGGLLKKDFKSAEFPFFESARPEKNALKKPVWTLDMRQRDRKLGQAICAAPFDSSGLFKGTIALTVSLSKIAARSFSSVGPQGEIMLFLNGENQIVSLDDAADSDLAPQIQQLVQDLPKERDSHFEQVADFYVQSSPSRVLPLTLISLLRDVQAIKLGLTSPVPVTSQSRPWILGTVGASVLLLLLNSFWVIRTQQGIASSHRQLSQSLSALADLDLDSAFTRRPGDLFERLDKAVQSVKDRLELLAAERKEEAAETIQPTEANPPLPVAAAAELEMISTRFKVLSCFDTRETVEVCLSRLAKLLAEIFQVQRVWFLFYSPAERLLRTSVTGHIVPSAALDPPAIRLNQGGLFEKVVGAPQIFWANCIGETPTESDFVNRHISKNILICPLGDSQNVFALLVLGDKTGDFGNQDRDRFATLREPISSVLKDLMQCEGFRKIDLLRRAYCAELTKAIETPLNRIRGEVQSIYSRLGRLTPYYKQHCETILFEVGKLYEIGREASELGLDSGESADSGA